MATTASMAREVFEMHIGGGEDVPAILQFPRVTAPVPAVLLLHGFSSHKERMADSIGAALLRRNVASLAIDLPSHGRRDATPQELARQNPLALVKLWRLALREADAGIRFLGQHPAIDPARIAITGYSLGAYLATFAAAANDSVRAVVLAAGGDLPSGIPMERVIRAAADPRKAVRALAGRPLLMIHGKNDRTVRPALATALFDAAAEPKELRWYAGGHWPPAAMIDGVAEWLAEQLD